MKKILILEDHLDTLECLRDVLKQAGHEVIGVGTAKEAEKALEQNTPDIFIVDHDLGSFNPVVGRDVVENSGLTPQQCLGISSNFPQSYCSKQFKNKDHLTSVRPQKQEAAKIELLSLIDGWY